MKVWTVAKYGGFKGVYATEELAKEACAYANYNDEMCGGRGGYYVEEIEVKTDTEKVPDEYRKTYYR